MAFKRFKLQLNWTRLSWVLSCRVNSAESSCSESARLSRDSELALSDQLGSSRSLLVLAQWADDISRKVNDISSWSQSGSTQTTGSWRVGSTTNPVGSAAELVGFNRVWKLISNWTYSSDLDPGSTPSFVAKVWCPVVVKAGDDAPEKAPHRGGRRRWIQVMWTNILSKTIQ